MRYPRYPQAYFSAKKNEQTNMERFSPLYQPAYQRRAPVGLVSVPTYEQPIERRGKFLVTLERKHVPALVRVPIAPHAPRFAAHDRRRVQSPEWDNDLYARINPHMMTTFNTINYASGQRPREFD